MVRWKYDFKKKQKNKTATCSVSCAIICVFVLVKQVQKGWGGLGVLWVVHKWEEQGHRRRTEQQHWTGRLPVRVAPWALSWLPGSRPTACRSAVHRPTALQHRHPVLNHRRILSASTKCARSPLTPTDRRHTISSSRCAGMKRTPLRGATPTSWLTPRRTRRTTRGRVPLASRSRKSLWCSAGQLSLHSRRRLSTQEKQGLQHLLTHRIFVLTQSAVLERPRTLMFFLFCFFCFFKKSQWGVI